MRGYEAFERMIENMPPELLAAGDDAELEASWFAQHDIGMDGLTRWAVEQTLHDLEILGPTFEAEDLGGALAAAYHIGLVMGIRLEAERQQGRNGGKP